MDKAQTIKEIKNSIIEANRSKLKVAQMRIVGKLSTTISLILPKWSK